MPLTIKILESNSEISRRILKSLAKSLNDAAMSALPEIIQQIKKIVKAKIEGSREYGELKGGRLQGELGVPNSPSRLSTITEIWITGGFSIGMIKKDWSDVLSSPESSYITDKGKNIPWLEWLLIAGDKTIIDDYVFSPNITEGARSRTGLGIMKQAVKRRWRVPSEYAGTTQNNFVTRSLDGIADDVINIISKEISRKIK
jgi:hypothetical protein